jgi:protein-disulfide isomerase
MASRTRQKEEARARRIAEEQARAEREHRQRRVRLIGGIVVAAIAVVAVAIAISSGGGSSGLKTGTAATATSKTVQQLLNGIPQSGATLGNPNAPVTMEYYGDLECPICRDFTLNGGFGQLVANEVREGKVKVVYRALQSATRDPSVFREQQVAALAAGKQNKFWHFAELFYREQGTEGSGYVTNSYLAQLASQVPGLNLSEWQSARSDSGLAGQVSSDGSTASAAGINSTPTLIFSGPKGKTGITGVATYSQLQQAIQQVS